MEDSVKNKEIDSHEFKIARILGFFLLFTNITSILLGIIILFGVNLDVIGNLIGIVMLFTFISNIFINNIALVKKNYVNVSHAAYLEMIIIYEIIIFFSALMLGVGNFQQSFTYANSTFNGSMGLILRIPGYFIPFLFELFVVKKSFLNKKSMERKSLAPPVLDKFLQRKKLRKFLNIFLKIANVGISITALVFVIVMYGVAPFPIYLTSLDAISLGVFGILIAPFAIFYGMATFVNGYVAVKLNHRYRLKEKHNKAISISLQVSAVLSIVVALLFSASLFSVPSTIENAEMEFNSVFGEEWMLVQESSTFEEDSKYFLEQPVMLDRYFLPKFEDNCQILTNILFYNDKTGIDNNISLFYDVYMPIGSGKNLPGQNTTIIRIHGGAWMFGDKGEINMIQMSKYLASQGYIVFDIQYGLYNISSIPDMPSAFSDLPQNQNRIGNFSLDDFIRHIGLFTKHLEVNFQKYGANLDSVFISGGSAGGNLCCAATLAMLDERYADMFSSELEIKGYIPLYPANEICRADFLDSNEDFIDPKRMVCESSPPCLIFQGTNDGLVNPCVQEQFKHAYLDNGNDDCCVISLKLAAHAFDVYYSGYYNQIMLYFAERFFYTFK